MQYELGVADRIHLLNILPREGDFRTIKVIQDLRTGKAGLGFSEEELEILNFETVPTADGQGYTKWNPLGNRPKKIEIGSTAHEIISTTLLRLEKEKKLTVDLIHLYELFAEEKKDSKPKTTKAQRET